MLCRCRYRKRIRCTDCFINLCLCIGDCFLVSGCCIFISRSLVRCLLCCLSRFLCILQSLVCCCVSLCHKLSLCRVYRSFRFLVLLLCGVLVVQNLARIIDGRLKCFCGRFGVLARIVCQLLLRRLDGCIQFRLCAVLCGHELVQRSLQCILRSIQLFGCCALILKDVICSLDCRALCRSASEVGFCPAGRCVVFLRLGFCCLNQIAKRFLSRCLVRRCLLCFLKGNLCLLQLINYRVRYQIFLRICEQFISSSRNCDRLLIACLNLVGSFQRLNPVYNIKRLFKIRELLRAFFSDLLVNGCLRSIRQFVVQI